MRSEENMEGRSGPRVFPNGAISTSYHSGQKEPSENLA